MVFFTCNACGESLKKAQVEKHVNMCRGCEILSCIDCGKDLWGNDYKNHIKCITEDQKYGGKGFEAKSKKGDVKQQQWIQRIQEAMNKPGISANLKGVLYQVSSYDNVPRKKAKFQNWMKNSLKIYNSTLYDQVWEIFSAATSNTSSEETGETKPVVEINGNGSQPLSQNCTSAKLETEEKKKLNKRERKEARQRKAGKKEKRASENGNVEEVDADPGKRKDKKRKRSSEEAEQNGNDADVTTKKFKKSKKDHSKDDQSPEGAEDEENAEEEEDTEGKSGSKGKFNWKGTIKAVLRQSPEGGIAVKKLRKKVLSAYYSFSAEGNFKSEEELLALFNKKLKGNPKFRVLKDKVRLIK
ncbi:cell growth-regulating nucleolar protein [Esox lucius]|uniref:Cell growth-regulating nucleolar protein n=1 Tax=Esox lucius TaxID=8010 RepID=C1BWD8_ESOLU|nr:cell growth-regulating nucleolar protein [Esox lucius]ACO13341.1 Cell growth-regulating nucleolar protein [Esox lucius]